MNNMSRDYGGCNMAEEKTFDEVIDERYKRTSDLRERVIDHFTGDQEAFKLAMADKDSAAILIKMIDGQDKQTIARQRNRTEEAAVGAFTNVQGVVKQVIAAMGGPKALRGEADITAAPKGTIDCDVEVIDGELAKGSDENLNVETLMQPKSE